MTPLKDVLIPRTVSMSGSIAKGIKILNGINVTKDLSLR